MNNPSPTHTATTITRKWWFLAIVLPMLCLLYALPTYSTQSFDPRQTGDLIVEVFSHAPLYAYPAIFPIFKILTVVLIAGIIFLGDRVTRVFFAYGGIVILASAWLQNMADTPNYGFAVMTGNIVIFSIVALLWIWEAVAKKSDFSQQKPPLWKYWVVPLAFLSFWEPANLSSSTPVPDFSPLLLLTSDGAVTFCMVVPVYLSILTLFYPKVNRLVLCITGFVGTATGLLNMMQWFILMPEGWWMGILHIPLLSISIYAFVLSLRKQDGLSTGHLTPSIE